jgi:hypothetical protein
LQTRNKNIVIGAITTGILIAFVREKRTQSSQQANLQTNIKQESPREASGNPDQNSRTARKDNAKRVSSAFDKDSHEDITQYLDWLRDAIASCVNDLRRTVLITLLLIAIFELVLESPESSASHISIGSFEISKGSVTLLFIPMLVAYLYFQMQVESVRLYTLRHVFSVAFSKWSSKAAENDLDVFIHPAMPVYWDVYGNAEDKTNRPLTTYVESIAALPFMVVIIVGVVGFEIQAYSSLRRQSSTNHSLWLISASVASFCIIIAFIYNIFWDNSDKLNNIPFRMKEIIQSGRNILKRPIRHR